MTNEPTPTPIPDTAVDVDTSIIDTILDLDDLLSGEEHRAETSFTLYTKPHLEAEINALELELERLSINADTIDTADEASVGDSDADGQVEAIARKIQAKRREYSESGRLIRLRQLSSDDWTEFEAKWKDPLSKGAPYPAAMWNELISTCAAEPEMPVAKVQQLRKKLGHPPLQRLALECWGLNTEGGVSVPFSKLASAALKPGRRAKS